MPFLDRFLKDNPDAFKRPPTRSLAEEADYLVVVADSVADEHLKQMKAQRDCLAANIKRETAALSDLDEAIHRHESALPAMPLDFEDAAYALPIAGYEIDIDSSELSIEPQEGEDQ